MLSELAKSLRPYVAGEQPRKKDAIKLNTNESPYPPSPAVAQAVRRFASDTLRLYPDPACTQLRKAIAAHENVDEENVFVGNGSDEVLALSFAAFFNRDKPIAFADVTYSFYPVYCRLLGIPYRTVPLSSDWRISRAGYTDAAGVVIANPNAPTSLYEDVSQYIHSDVPVLIDEAYIDFAGKPSLAQAAAKSENAVVIKTFSKSYALAGARCGYAVASAENINGLCRVRDSFNSYTVNAVTQAAATAAICDEAYHAQTVARIVATRDECIDALRRKGYECLPSATNFLFVTLPNAEKKYAALKKEGIFVRWFSAPRLIDKLRISIGTEADMQKLLSFF